MNLTARVYLLFLCCASPTAMAGEIKLTKAYEHRKKFYQHFKTEDLNLSALLALREATREPEPEKSEEIATAIANREYKKATNVVYFDPPFTYNNELFSQLYIYQKSENFRRFLANFLKALEEHPCRAAYAYAIGRIRLRLKATEAAAAAPAKPPKAPKKRERPRAQEVVAEETETKRATAEPAAAPRPPDHLQEIGIPDDDLFVPDPEGREEFYRLLAQMPSAISGL